jgi:two-component system, OmpR family, response regulator BaeR
MNTTRHVLVVEDDAKIAQLLLDYLQQQGFAASVIANGQLALQQIKAAPPALVILDLMLPGMDGIAVCRAVRQFSQLPILMLTARVDEVDRLLGLDTGADDYVCKPFSPREVMARVRALIRRSDCRTDEQTDGATTASAARWTVDESGLRGLAPAVVATDTAGVPHAEGAAEPTRPRVFTGAIVGRCACRLARCE